MKCQTVIAGIGGQGVLFAAKILTEIARRREIPVLQAQLGTVNMVSAPIAAKERGIEITETRSTRARDYASLVSLKLHTGDGERWAEGTVFEPNSPRSSPVKATNTSRRPRRSFARFGRW